jgi:hypothetical protein
MRLVERDQQVVALAAEVDLFRPNFALLDFGLTTAALGRFGPLKLAFQQG